MTVNALATGLIVFRIFKVFYQVKDNTTSEEKSIGITGGTKLRSVIFVIIESGMALFAIQLVRLVLATIDTIYSYSTPWKSLESPYNLIISIHGMLNVIISSVILLYVLLITWTSLGYSTNHHPGAGVNRIIFPR